MPSLSGPEFIPTSKPDSAVIFLHGLGSNGDDLISLAPHFASVLPKTAFFSPNAPISLQQMANGFQWFEYWDRTIAQIEDDLSQAVPLIVDYVTKIADRLGIENKKIILCGFSQGTMMALHTGLRYIDDLGGIIGFSGALLSPETLGANRLQSLPPVLLVHGLQDEVVPAMASAQAEILLRTLGADVHYVQRPSLAHSIDNKGLEEAGKFCQQIFTSA